MKEEERDLRGKMNPNTRFGLKCVLCYITRLEKKPCTSSRVYDFVLYLFRTVRKVSSLDRLDPLLRAGTRTVWSLHILPLEAKGYSLQNPREWVRNDAKPH